MAVSIGAEQQNSLQNAKKNCILHLSTDRNIGAQKAPLSDTPYMTAVKTASSVWAQHS